ncbi:uncharacterized protein LOC127711490 [Mytilus californianus]|uniref:uncharacterized protein LOC127711490 n=1 Tax=Mytilus californianus TaxID=6549 RepID=UPI0022485301|nr:uncharacterized protein LOC127711490 [Mytilus californianus]
MSVYDSWKSQSLCNDLPNYQNVGKAKHRRNPIIDHWADTHITMVKVELYKEDVQVVWMTFNAQNTDNLNWFSKKNFYQSSFTDLSPCSKTNYFSAIGQTINARRFFINKNYGGCANDNGWFCIKERKDTCKWSQFNKYPVFMYTKNERNWTKDAVTADTLVISIAVGF